jgi:hypothetical protein
MVGHRTKIVCAAGVVFALWRAFQTPTVYGGEIDPVAWEWIAWAMQFAAWYFFAAKIPPGFFQQVMVLLKDLLPLFLRLIEVLRTVKPEPSPEPVPDVFPQARSTEDDSGIVDLPKVVGSLLVLCCLAGAASAEPPKAVIQGAEPSAAGEICVFDATGSENEPTHYSWDIQPEVKGRRQLLEIEGKKRVVIATFPGRYLLTLTVSNPDGHSMAHREITVPGAAPLPAPGPQPTPPAPGPTPAPPTPAPPSPTPGPPAPEPLPPTPPCPPESRFNLTKDIAAWAKDVPKAERESYAGICDAMAAEIVATPANFSGANIKEVGEKIAAALAKKVGAPRFGLIPLLMKLNNRVRELSPQLKTLDDWAGLFREVAAGLRWGA